MIERLTVCGLGKLGCSIAAVFADAGISVAGIDLDAEKVEAINNCRLSGKQEGQNGLLAEEPRLGELLSRTVPNGTLRATTNAAEATHNSDACIFVTPTPSLPNGSFDNAPLLAAIKTIAKSVTQDEKSGSRGPYLFIVASTVNPGTCQNEILPLLREICVRPFHLVYKPEFIALGTVIRDLTNPDFLLIGASSTEAADMVGNLYSAIASAPLRCMSFMEAELAKISLNCFVTMKISFANQLGAVADKLGADAHVILEAIGNDRRIGLAAFKPGLPFGGPCLPRDGRMFQYTANSVGVGAPLAQATDTVNTAVVESIVLKALEHEGDIGILGMAYKAGTSFTEESAGKRIAKSLERWRIVKTNDPIALHSHSLEEVLRCPILIVATPWPEYESLPVSEETFLIDPMRVVRTRIVSSHKVESARQVLRQDPPTF